MRKLKLFDRVKANDGKEYVITFIPNHNRREIYEGLSANGYKRDFYPEEIEAIPDPRDTRISELEQCIRENYEALRDKAMRPKSEKLSNGKTIIISEFVKSELSIHEQSFMLKAESLLKLKEGK